MTKEELENYEPKGQLIGFPKEVIARMLDCQEEQGNKRDVTVFEKHNSCSLGAGGFDWDETKEEDVFWLEVISYKNFNVFFEKYPKICSKYHKKENKMIKEELENKLKISKDTAIHCPTLELAKKVLDIFHKLGLKWCNGIYYTKCTDWDRYKENTIYYPFEGRFSSLKHFQQLNGKIISAKEFITLHTEKDEFDLENYEPKGELTGFPKEIIARMLECQEEQGNKKDVNVFEKNIIIGFTWDDTKEGGCFWYEVITKENFNLFFKRYPKKEDNSQEFKIGDEVIDIISGVRGKVTCIDTLPKNGYPIFVDFDDNETAGFTLDGKYYSLDKYPRLLHYRDDYDYSVIDFNNLPKRQEANRWRAEKGEIYYFFTSNFEIEHCYETNILFNDEDYNSGNYFRTEEQAQDAADKLKEYFNQLINK